MKQLGTTVELSNHSKIRATKDKNRQERRVRSLIRLEGVVKCVAETVYSKNYTVASLDRTNFVQVFKPTIFSHIIFKNKNPNIHWHLMIL